MPSGCVGCWGRFAVSGVTSAEPPPAAPPPRLEESQPFTGVRGAPAEVRHAGQASQAFAGGLAMKGLQGAACGSWWARAGGQPFPWTRQGCRETHHQESQALLVEQELQIIAIWLPFPSV